MANTWGTDRTIDFYKILDFQELLVGGLQQEGPIIMGFPLVYILREALARVNNYIYV